MMYDSVKCIKTDVAIAEVGMAVFVGTTRILAVIDMEYSNLIFSD